MTAARVETSRGIAVPEDQIITAHATRILPGNWFFFYIFRDCSFHHTPWSLARIDAALHSRHFRFAPNLY